MFAALCENPEFFRPRLKLFIAIAPVVYLSNLESEILKQNCENQLCIAALEAIGPEILQDPAATNPVMEWIINSLVAQKIADFGLKHISDS